MKKILVTALLTTIGILGLQTIYIKTTSSENLIKTIRSIRGNTSKETKTKKTKQETLTFDITKITTGYKGLQPAIKITVKNNSGKDITDFNEFKAVFLLGNDVYGDASKYMTSTSDFLPKASTKTIVLKPLKRENLFEELRKGKPNVKVSLYLNNDKIKELPVDYVKIEDGTSLREIYQREVSNKPSSYDGLGVEK